MTEGVIVKPKPDKVIDSTPFNFIVAAFLICSEFPTRIFLGRKHKIRLSYHWSHCTLLGGA